MTDTTDIEVLVIEGQAVEERLYKRVSRKSARALDVDACVVIAKITDALERQQAVVEAARVVAEDINVSGPDNVLVPLDKALAALDAPKAIHADLKAVAVALKNSLTAWYIPNAEEIDKALSRPGVQAVLEGKAKSEYRLGDALHRDWPAGKW